MAPTTPLSAPSAGGSKSAIAPCGATKCRSTRWASVACSPGVATSSMRRTVPIWQGSCSKPERAGILTAWCCLSSGYQLSNDHAAVWNECMETHKAARQTHMPWPGRNELQKATKGRYGLHSQSIQMIVHAFLANVATTRQLRKTHPQMNMKYPWRTKRFYPVSWPAQAVSRERGRVVLPMGKGPQSLVLPIDLPENSGACTLVWNNGFELHVCVETKQAEQSPGKVHATVDLGEIHLAAVTTNTEQALIVTGRGIRSLKRQRHHHVGKIAR